MNDETQNEEVKEKSELDEIFEVRDEVRKTVETMADQLGELELQGDVLKHKIEESMNKLDALNEKIAEKTGIKLPEKEPEEEFMADSDEEVDDVDEVEVELLDEDDDFEEDLDDELLALVDDEFYTDKDEYTIEEIDDKDEYIARAEELMSSDEASARRRRRRAEYLSTKFEKSDRRFNADHLSAAKSKSEIGSTPWLTKD